MDNLTGSIIGAFGFAVFNFQKVLKNLAQHFGINCHLFFQRFVFFDGKIVEVKDIQNATTFIADSLAVGENIIRDDDVRSNPVVIAGEQASV